MSDEQVVQRVTIVQGQAFAFDPVQHVGLGAIKVGDRVRIKMKRSYGDDGLYTGVVVGFEPFRSGPAVIVAYMAADYSGAEIKFISISDQTKDVEMIKATDADLARIDVPQMRLKLQAHIARKESELDDLRRRLDFFEKNVAESWSAVSLKADAQRLEKA